MFLDVLGHRRYRLKGDSLMARTRRKRSHRSRFGRLVRRALIAGAAIVLASAAAAGAILYFEFTAALPPVSHLAEYRPPTATQVLADDGTVIGEFYVEKRYLLPFDRIPRIVREAFIAAEDDGFYKHGAIDVLSILRAAINNFTGGSLQGGSTITQQVVKMLLLTPEKSYERKLKEMVLAFRLERHLSKDEILSLYLNHIYLGSGAYGVAAASQAYFGKSIDNVNLAEAALLAGLPQAPSRYSPTHHWQHAKARQRYVLRRMEAAGFITAEQRDAALRQPIALAPRKGSYRAAPYYVEYVRRLLEERYGSEALYHLGLKVYTAANVAMTSAAENSLRAELDDLDRQHGGSRKPVRHLGRKEVRPFLRQESHDLGSGPLESGKPYEGVVASTRGHILLEVGSARGILRVPSGKKQPPLHLTRGDVMRVVIAAAEPGGHYQFELDPEPLVQGALTAVEPDTGYVKVMVGGYDFKRSQFNRVTQAARQPGSAFKPLIYAAAFDHGFTPASIILDAPVSFPDNHGVWTPKNYEQRFFGPTTLRDALTFSRNVPTVKMAASLGMPYIIKYLRREGINTPLAPNLSIALGSSEVSLLELVSAYEMFANQGRRAKPIFITRIIDNEGHTIYEAKPHIRQAIPATVAYQVTSILQDVIRRGTGRRAASLGRPAAGKTGTTNDLNDAWFIGYTPQLLAGVWVGYDEKRSLGHGQTGGRVAAPVWLHFMERALNGMPVVDFPVPPGIVLTPINPHTGERAVPGDPGAIIEAFRKGTVPTTVAAAATQPDTASAAREFFRSEY